jgi:hypothetical protein
MSIADKISIVPTNHPKVAVCILHCDSSTVVELIECLNAQFIDNAIELAGVKSIALFKGDAGDRIAIYVQSNSSSDCTAFLDSTAVKLLYRLTEAHGARGKFHAYAVPYVLDSSTGPISHFQMSYSGV